MMELNYKPDQKSGWPVSATGENFKLTFSGSFSGQRVQGETLHNILELSIKVILWLLVALGCVAFALSLWQAVPTKDWLFLLKPNSFNLVFWITAFTTAYLWAKLTQDKLQEGSLNLLHWEVNVKSGKNSTIDVYDLFNKDSRKVWKRAWNLSRSRQKYLAKLVGKQAVSGSLNQVSAADLFLSLLDCDSVKLTFWRLGVNTDDIKTLVKNYAILMPEDSQDELDRVPFLAFTESLKLHNKSVDPLMLLCALVLALPQEHIIQSVFFNLNVTVEKLEILCSWVFNLQLLREEMRLFRKLSRLKPEKEINRGLTSVPTYYLDHYSTDLTRMAKHGALPLALGRGADLRGLFSLLSSGKKNLVIKGPEGAGRTTLVNELAYKMATEQVPHFLEDKRLVRLEISAILGNPQKSENVFIHALQEAEKAGNIVLVIEDLHALTRAQTTSGFNLLDLLVDFLQSSELMVVGTTTIEDYTDYLQNAPGFEEGFTSYELQQLTRENIILACCIKASLLETKDRCFFRYQAIEKAVDLTDLYVRGLSQPQKAIAVLVEAASKSKNSDIKIVSEEMVDKIVSEKTHIPTQALSQNEADKLLRLEEELSKYIVGQTQAVTAVAEGLRRARSGLASTGRPLASFLFLGPTGVGKTEVARTLAKTYFGEEKYLLRLDMSEYQGSEGLTKLLGTEKSKVDSPMVKHLKSYPFCLLLLDEFEKASPEILNLFLQILEDGRMTSGKGELIDLTHALVIATSNAGTLDIQNGLKANKSLEQIKTELFNRALLRCFSPELLNRFDSIVLFSPLNPEEVEKITWLQLEQLRGKLKEKSIKASFTEAVAKDIAKNAFDPLLGARPVRRYIQDHLEGFIAKLILSKRAVRGTELVVDIQDGKLIVK